MRISGITFATSHPKVSKNAAKTPNFQGHWEERESKWPLYSPGKTHKIKDYIPDENESLVESVYAWERETGKKPFQWAQENNMYRPIGECDVQYRFNGTPFLPVSLLKASADEDLKYSKDNMWYTNYREIEAQMKVAWLDAQADNREGVKGNEAQLERLYISDHNSKFGDVEYHLLDIYKKDYPHEIVERRDAQARKEAMAGK